MEEKKTQEEMVKEAVEEAKKAAEEQAEEVVKEAVEDEIEITDSEEVESDETEVEEENGKKRFGRKPKKDKKDEKIEELTDKLTRQMAEFDNFRKRTEKEKSAMYEIGAKDIIEKILPIVDNFERAFQTVAEEDKEDAFVTGMEMIYKQILTTLEGVGVKPIDAVGQEFNPDLHNAVMQVESEEFESGVIAQELQKGYTYRDTVVRYSMVAVVS